MLRNLLVIEALVCFALPLYFLFWGVISFPLWTGGLGSGAAYLWWYVFDVVGGLLGIVGIVILLRYGVTDSSVRAFPAVSVGAFALAGLLAVWQAPSDGFSEFNLNLGTFLLAIMPTLCTLHLYVLALMRSRKQ